MPRKKPEGPIGFARLPKEERSAFARKGGQASRAAYQVSGKGHRFTSEEAKAAGRLGGLATAQNPENLSRAGKWARASVTSSQDERLPAQEESPPS